MFFLLVFFKQCCLFGGLFCIVVESCLPHCVGNVSSVPVKIDERVLFEVGHSWLWVIFGYYW